MESDKQTEGRGEGGEAPNGRGDGLKFTPPSRSVTFERQSSSPPTSTESLPEKEVYSSSGVDSPPVPSLSDIPYMPRM